LIHEQAIRGAVAEAKIEEASARLAKGDEAFAVRSSATVEDLPTASFEGQQDSYLNGVSEAIPDRPCLA